MNIAIIGAGLSGLATAWNLLQTRRCRLTIFDAKGVGGGASGVASGLMHPYVGEQGRRSQNATEALAETHKLIQIAEEALNRLLANRVGIVRYSLTADQRLNFYNHSQAYGDIEQLSENAFLITSGVTIDVLLYLQGLWQACKNLGAVFYPVKITTLQQLKDYDRVVIAAGAGVVHLTEGAQLPVKLIKGQILTCEWPKELAYPARSLIAKGYVATCSDAKLFHLGATYERRFDSEEPCLKTAERELRPKFELFAPGGGDLAVVGVRAGIRVANLHHYAPIVRQLFDKVWVITAMGSRGLLYHAYAAKSLSESVFQKKFTS